MVGLAVAAVEFEDCEGEGEGKDVCVEEGLMHGTKMLACSQSQLLASYALPCCLMILSRCYKGPSHSTTNCSCNDESTYKA